MLIRVFLKKIRAMQQQRIEKICQPFLTDV
jgi:hypothetical protein